MDDEAPDEIWCLGDLVGYGPRPNECTASVAQRADLCLIGNHDLAALGRIDLLEFNEDAAASARWTASTLTDDTREFLARLEPRAEREGIGLYHASPRDPVWEYVLSAEVAAASIAAAPESVSLVGHSHVALAFSLDGNTPAGGLAPDGTELDLASAERWLLNPGSVGQPRDGDPNAAFLVLDLGLRQAVFRRVPYPIERTQEDLRAAGLPDSLAIRLEHGL